MTALPSPARQPRRLICAGCGSEFGCTMDAQCWCAAEAVMLPMPSDAADCLCPECLRELARASRPTGDEA